MKLKIILTLAISTTLLAACGGGGGGGESSVSTVESSVSTVDNPLKKYEGTYYVCDGHSKETVTVTATGSNAISMSYIEDVYQNTNCTGPIVGTYRLPQPVIATYQNQTTANFPPVTLLPNAAPVDRVILSSPSMTAQLTGSGVNGSCVKYTGGNFCYDNLNFPAVTATGATYLTNNYFIPFSLVNGVLEADGIYSKDPNFNYEMLVID